MRKIWETVAEDYAPFNVNVTTVEPPSFANGAAVRVVFAGNTTATLDRLFLPDVKLSGNRFITNDNGASLLDTSGYSAVGSYTNGEPNVVYVFAEYMKTWGTTSPEGHARTLAALVANTASHEAGHSFGLWHHTGVDAGGAASDYHVGTTLTTPIMGDNTAADRTLWSSYTSYGTSFDAVQHLTTVLGSRMDDHASGTWFAEPLTFTGTYNFTSQATVKGIIGTTSDQDWFRFSTTGGGFSFDVKGVELGNLDAKLEIFRATTTPYGPGASLIASIDGPTLAGAPFSGLGASTSLILGAGDYYVVVKSHGGYGDLGNYTLKVSQNPVRVNPGGVLGWATMAADSGADGSRMMASEGLAPSVGGGGAGAAGVAKVAARELTYASAATTPVSRLNLPKAETFEARVWEDLDLSLGARIRQSMVA
jgi:hypothetical protein